MHATGQTWPLVEKKKKKVAGELAASSMYIKDLCADTQFDSTLTTKLSSPLRALSPEMQSSKGIDCTDSTQV